MALLAGGAATAAAQTTTAPVKIDAGTVTGVVAGDVAAYKGIPFAAPPVGDLRWQAPQPVKPWTAVLAADHYAADCMQKPFGGDAAPLGTPPAEDCLYLNVGRRRRGAAKLPVMVWIYGGAFVNGGNSPAVYDGPPSRAAASLRQHELPDQALRLLRAPGADRRNAEGHAARQLRLPRSARRAAVGEAQCAAFGGDPSNVTIFGESAGGDR
jgi:para-nitrobenzyl esterase